MTLNHKLLDRVLGQTEADDANTRGVALETARRMLKAEGLTLRDLLASHVRLAERETREATSKGEAGPAQTRTAPQESRQASTISRSEYVKPDGTARTVHKARVGFFTRNVDGKRVVRGMKPPNGAIGRLRILEDRIVERPYTGPRHVLTLSFETEHTLYEPFVDETYDDVWVDQAQRLSHTGGPLRT